MSTVSTFNFTDGISGGITKTGISYSASTGSSNVTVSYNAATGARRYAFMQFDTSSIPDAATIELVELKIVEALAQPSTPPQQMSVYIGSWIGGSLDGSSADYNGGNYMFSAASLPDGYYDLSLDGNDPTVYVNRTGTTDIKITDDSNLIICGRNFNTAKSKCQLRVTWSILPRLALLGVG